MNDRQREAAWTLDRHVSVTAGPGAGKTTVLVERYLEILRTRDVTVDQIVAITFTNRAANEMRERDLYAHVRRMEGVLRSALEELARKHPIVREIRGMGLLFAVVLGGEAAPVVDACRERGLLINSVQGTILRLLPPLIVTDAEIGELVSILDDALTALGR